jgi:putative integral membrane protein (TIGR02587 family)
MSTGAEKSKGELNREFVQGLGRAFGGAVFFALPILMTMETWALGFYMDRLRLALLLVLMIPVLVGLDYYSGFRDSSIVSKDVLNALVAVGVAFCASALILSLFFVIDASMPPEEVVGKLVLQAVPASFGAMLANSQFGGGAQDEEEAKRQREAGYGAELFLMCAGATFFAFNVAPTEEIVLIAVKMKPWHALALVVLSLAITHGFFEAVSKGEHRIPEEAPWWSLFLRYSLVAYALALLISAYVLWTFGRDEGTSLRLVVQEAVVLGLPATLGAAAARLIL